MDKLYVAILVIEDGGIWEITNQEIDIDKKTYIYEGFEFKIAYIAHNFIQFFVYAYNTYTTRVLGVNVENSGERVGLEMDSPMLVETDGGFAGVLCSYIIQFSRHPINIEHICQSIMLNEKGRLIFENYYKIIYLSCK